VKSKLVSMRDAIAQHVPDGSSVALGLALEALIPFAAGHELIRQKRRDLTLIGPISDILFDQLIGAGCVRAVIAAWVGNVSAGLGYNYRRAAENGIPNPIRIEDHSNFTIALSLQAGALGAPFIPAHTLLGSDILSTNPNLRPLASPLDGERVLLVPAIVPDVTVLHVQRADESGACHCWGNLGVSEEGGLAAKRVIVVAEEIVSPQVIKSDPNRVLVPPQRVSAVVHEPGGAHPSPVQGYYARDTEFYHEYHAQSKTAAEFEAWKRRWIDGIGSRNVYLKLLGSKRWHGLQVKERKLAAPVNYSAT
jgi:glutaconate CoA-transferase, subunit A